MEKKVQSYHVLDVNDDTIAVAFVYEDGTKEILDITHGAIKQMIKALGKAEEDN